jgi:hypothetical protein
VIVKKCKGDKGNSNKVIIHKASSLPRNECNDGQKTKEAEEEEDQ